MSPTLFPFDLTTGELLPAHRDAYLRGDMPRQHAALVEAYLQKNLARQLPGAPPYPPVQPQAGQRRPAAAQAQPTHWELLPA